MAAPTPSARLRLQRERAIPRRPSSMAPKIIYHPVVPPIELTTSALDDSYY